VRLTTQIEASVLAYFRHLKAPEPTGYACPSREDRVYLRCPWDMLAWCRSCEYTDGSRKRRRFIEQRGVGRWITRRLHKRPLLGYRLIIILREDVPGVDRFALQINVWRDKGGELIFEVDFDGFGAIHFPSVIGHVAMGLVHKVARRKTDQRDVMLALRERGVDVIEVAA
jgi:hypothetical protein